jgi:periplasmic protein TonB
MGSMARMPLAASAILAAGLSAGAWAQTTPDPPSAARENEASAAPAQPSVETDKLSAPAPPTPPTGVNWVSRPTADDFARHYPHDALRNNIEGLVILDCIVGADGRLTCTVFSESPLGHGFGEAALRIAREFRMARQTRDGRSTEGGRARVPISFRIG